MIEELKKGSKYRLVVNVSIDGERVGRKTKVVECGKREANRLYAEFEKEVRDSFSYTNAKISDVVGEYIESCRLRGLSPTTIDKYECDKRRLFSILKDKTALKVSSVDVNNLVAQMQKKGYSAKTIRNTETLLSASIEREVKLGRLPKNPCRSVRLPKREQKEPNTLPKEDLAKFMEILDSLELDVKVGLELALFKGLRRSEIMGLKPSDYNADDGTLWVRRSRHKTNGEMVIKEPKNQKSWRLLALPKALADDIELLIKQHEEADYECADFLILYFGQPMEMGYLNNTLARKLKQNGMEHISLHGLRHSFATLMLNSLELDIAQISRELGHSNITTTLNIYSHAMGGQIASSQAVSLTTDSLMKTCK